MLFGNGRTGQAQEGDQLPIALAIITETSYESAARCSQAMTTASRSWTDRETGEGSQQLVEFMYKVSIGLSSACLVTPMAHAVHDAMT